MPTTHKIFNMTPQAMNTIAARKRFAHGLVGAGIGASAGLLADKALDTDSPWLASTIGALGGVGASQLLTNTKSLPKTMEDAVEFQKLRHNYALPAGPVSQIYGTPSFNAWLHPALGSIALGGTLGALNSDYGPMAGAIGGGTIGGLLGMLANRGMLYGARFPHVYSKSPEIKQFFNAHSKQ
jgi:hypothetical protein